MERHTLARPIEVTDVGLHGGRITHARLDPAAPGHGWTLNGARVGIDAVRDAMLATTLHTPTGPVATVEHLFAALAGRRIDDVAIVVTGGEVPLLDGSAAVWARHIDPVRHPGHRDPLRVDAPLEVGDGDTWLRATPAEALTLAVTVDFPHLGRQHFTAPAVAFDRAADARTFGFVADAEALHARGRALGVTLDNTLVFDHRGRPMRPLRHPDEPARHKWLDLLGDLALLGRPLVAHVEGHCAGHALHHRLVRALLAAAG